MAYTAAHISANRKQTATIWAPADAATAQLVDLGQPQAASVLMVPIKEFKTFSAQATVSLLGGTGIVAFSIYCGTSAAGANPTSVVAHALGSLPNAVGDSVFLETNVDQIHDALATATHVGVWLDCQHNDDETAITFTSESPTFPRADLTADYVS